MNTEEQESAEGSKAAEQYVLHLYITGATPNSQRAVANIRMLCDTYLENRYQLEIIDVYQEPETAAREQLIALPLLIKKHPLPERKIIGDLSDTEKVVTLLGLKQKK
ncbi:MAG TPA: circadian clock KaiB family protein [Flavisolibacter sp.]|jgi:circadian clock protein KaiB|nr:circadian clock KaiB family protein [Flavisolibacter sp.]